MGLLKLEDADALPLPTAGVNVHDATLVCGDCLDLIRDVPDGSVALMVTSPPYDGLRTYGDTYTGIDLNALGHEVYRVLRPGGIAVMVIQDQTIEFAKSLTSIRTTLYWCDQVGFKLFEMLAYSRHGAPGAQWKTRFRVDHEYMPVFLKGDAPAYFDKSHLTTPALTAGHQMKGGAAKRQPDGTIKYSNKVTVAADTSRGTIWHYNIGAENAARGDTAALKRQHPAGFSDKLPYDHIKCWTRPGELVLDPFIGSGSTAVAALSAGRLVLGFDNNPKYVALATERCRQVHNLEPAPRPRRTLKG